MKLRIKYTKGRELKYIGHLDLMRFFQKAIKRSNLDIAYTEGFHPHQIMSFAAPLAMFLTSDGEYFDAEFNSVTSADDMLKRLNEQMPVGIKVGGISLLPDDAKKAMSIVTASDYEITILNEDVLKVKDVALTIMEKEEILVLRKTKRKEEVSDIKPGIKKIRLNEQGHIYMLLSTGSEYNLKPESVIEALCKEAGVKYDMFDYEFNRIETYTTINDTYISLLEMGDTEF